MNKDCPTYVHHVITPHTTDLHTAAYRDVCIDIKKSDNITVINDILRIP